MENHSSILSSGKEVMLTVVIKQMSGKIMNIPVPLGILCQTEIKKLLIATVIEHQNWFPSLVREEEFLCKGNLYEGQVGADIEKTK